MTKVLTKKQFLNVSKEQKAILVATDILKQIKNETYYPEAGVYIDDVYHSYNIIDEDYPFNNIRHCSVCVIGSSIVSAAKLSGVLDLEDIGSVLDDFSDDATDLLNSVFTLKEQLIMETCFEGYTKIPYTDIEYDEFGNIVIYTALEKFKKYIDESTFVYSKERPTFANKNKDRVVFNKLSYKEVLKCLVFRSKYKNDKNLLVGIMKNIIKNNGVFIP